MLLLKNLRDNLSKDCNAPLGENFVATAHQFLVVGPNTRNNTELFNAEILYRYPDVEFAPIDFKTFLFPYGIQLTEKVHQPLIFTFILTSDKGKKTYGATLQVYDLVKECPAKSRPRWMPFGLTILSSFAFYNLFCKFLQKLNENIPSTKQSEFLFLFMKELSGTNEDGYAIDIKLSDIWSIKVKRERSDTFPIVDFSYRPLFATLSINNILKIISALFVEKSVCFYSSHISLLTPVQEAFLSLLCPM